MSRIRKGPPAGARRLSDLLVALGVVAALAALDHALVRLLARQPCRCRACRTARRTRGAAAVGRVGAAGALGRVARQAMYARVLLRAQIGRASCRERG